MVPVPVAAKKSRSPPDGAEEEEVNSSALGTPIRQDSGRKDDENCDEIATPAKGNPFPG